MLKLMSIKIQVYIYFYYFDSYDKIDKQITS